MKKTVVLLTLVMAAGLVALLLPMSGIVYSQSPLAAPTSREIVTRQSVRVAPMVLETPTPHVMFLPIIFGGNWHFPRGAAMPNQLEYCGDEEALLAGWRYTWSYTNNCPGSPAQFVPMLWNLTRMQQWINDEITLPTGSGVGRYLLVLNEPNYKGQAVATPAEAAALWPALRAKADSHGLQLASPAVSACEAGYSDPNCLNTQWLEQFMALVDNDVDFVAVHYYGCNKTALLSYLDMRAGQFGKPLWLTEWACPNWAGDPVTYMQQTLCDVEDRVQRHAWFATRTDLWWYVDPLVNSDQTPTSLGLVLRNLQCP